MFFARPHVVFLKEKPGAMPTESHLRGKVLRESSKPEVTARRGFLQVHPQAEFKKRKFKERELEIRRLRG